MRTGDCGAQPKVSYYQTCHILRTLEGSFLFLPPLNRYPRVLVWEATVRFQLLPTRLLSWCCNFREEMTDEILMIWCYQYDAIVDPFHLQVYLMSGLRLEPSLPRDKAVALGNGSCFFLFRGATRFCVRWRFDIIPMRTIHRRSVVVIHLAFLVCLFDFMFVFLIFARMRKEQFLS